MVSTFPLVVLALSLLLGALYTPVDSNSTFASQKAMKPAFVAKNILMVTAHPDDEAMFFAPTMLALTRPDSGNHVKILCLSTGNADGLGETRRRELVKSGLMLGLRHEDDVFVLDSP